MDNETPQVTLAVAGSDATLTANSGSSSTDKKIILKTPSLSDSKHRDHKKARSNSVASKDLDAAPDSTGIIPNDACAGFDVLPKKRGSSSTSKGSSTKQRRRRRLRAVQGFKPCPQEILNGTSWKTRLADYFAIVSHDAKDGDHHHHSTIFPASAPSAVMPPVVTSMVPHEDYKDTKLPSDLGVFCFPDGITTVLASTKPSPLFHCFSLTNEVGIRLYVFCLRVFKPSDLSIGSAEGFHDYTPVALCIVSHHPFVSLFKAYLCGAYAIMSAPEKASCSVEAYISSILFRVPMPIPGVSEVVCSIDASHSMSVSLPLKTQFPFVDFPLRTMFDILGVSDALKVVFAVMLEYKVIITSKQYTPLFYFSETLTSLMYPFEWHHIYVPVLSESLLDYVQAPTPFIQGVPKDLFNLIPRNMLDDVIIVDVDKAKVTNFPANFPVPTMMDVIAEELLKVLWPNEVLFSDLILQEPRKEPTVHSLNTAIRTIFLKHYVSLFHNFRSYINFIKKYPNPLMTFESQAFCENKDKPFLRAFLDTQAFKVFTDRNTLQQSNLFNYAIEKYNNEGDRDLKFIAEEFTKALSSPLKRIVIPLPADEKSILSSSTGCSYEINYELVRYLSSDVDSTLGPTEKQQVVEWIPHGEEEEVIVQHGLLPKISYSTWSLYEIDYVSLCINMIFSGVEMTKEQCIILHKILLDKDGPLLFTQLFLDYTSTNQIRVVDDSAYNIISSVLYMVIFNSDENHDFLVPYNLLKPISAIYHEFALGSLSLWSNMEFWIYCFRCCIAKFRKSLSFHFRSTADEWSHMDEKAQKEAASKDETVLFNAIGEVSVLMSQLGIEEANVKKFISKCATTCRLEESLTSSLTVFATNIVKTQKANSASLLDLKKAKIVPPEKTAERLFKFTKRTRMTHKEIIRSLIPPLSPMQSPQGSGLGSQTDSSNSKAKGGRDDEGTVTIMKSKDGKSVIKHTYADGYDLYSLEPGIERGGISCMELYKGRIVIVGTKHGVITAWDLSLLQAASTSPPSSSSSSSSSNAIPSPTHVFTAQLPWGVAVAFIRVNKEYVVACSNSGIVTVLSVTTGERLATCTPHSTPVTAVALSDGGIVATGAEDGSVCLWSAVEPQGAELKTFRGHAGPVLSLCFGKRGSGTVISGGADKTVRMWDMGTCTMVAELAGQHKAGVMFVASLSSSKIVSGSEDCAKLWNVRKKAVVVAEFPNLKAPVASYVLARGSNSDVLLALCGSGSNALLCRWEVFNDVAGALKASPPGPTLAACSLGMSGEITAVGSADGAVRLWCSLAKPPLHTFRGHTGPVVALGCTPSGMVVSASEDSSVKVWRASGDTVERWSRGSLLPPKVAVSENSEGIFRFRHSTTETSLF